MEKKNSSWFKRVIDKIKECLIEIAILLSAASVLVPYIVDKLKTLIASISSLFN